MMSPNFRFLLNLQRFFSTSVSKLPEHCIFVKVRPKYEDVRRSIPSSVHLVDVDGKYMGFLESLTVRKIFEQRELVCLFDYLKSGIYVQFFESRKIVLITKSFAAYTSEQKQIGCLVIKFYFLPIPILVERTLDSGLFDANQVLERNTGRRFIIKSLLAVI